ncbi:MAG: peptidylprolyl isomerase [Caldilineaceae bacterium]|nr:peptidylprolyl isomerase [Caldilineaceae bacterium]
MSETNSIPVVIETGFGAIFIEVYPALAPVTAANFMQYVDEDRFTDACFYRVVRMDNQPNDSIKISVIQGGLKSDDHAERLPAILHETTAQTGLLHQNGAVSMARLNPGSACSEFFICINDQPELDFGGQRNPDGMGFAAFGKVTQGMDVVREIQAQSHEGQQLVKDVKMKVRRVEG